MQRWIVVKTLYGELGQNQHRSLYSLNASDYDTIKLYKSTAYLLPPFCPSTCGSGPSLGSVAEAGDYSKTHDPPKPCSDEVRLSSVPSFLRPSCSEGLYCSPPVFPPLAPSTCGSGPSDPPKPCSEETRLSG